MNDNDGYGAVEAAADAANIDILIDRCMRVFAKKGLFFGDENSKGDGEAVKVHMQPAVDKLMRLFERKHKLIDTCISRKPAADDRADEDVSLAEIMKEVMELGRQDFYDAIECDGNSDELAKTWSMPGHDREVEVDD